MKATKKTTWAEILAQVPEEPSNEPPKVFFEDFTPEQLLVLEAEAEKQKQLLTTENTLNEWKA